LRHRCGREEKAGCRRQDQFPKHVSLLNCGNEGCLYRSSKLMPIGLQNSRKREDQSNALNDASVGFIARKLLRGSMKTKRRRE
jgi:hypothetical protein